jgi:nucleotide-binding universal stress UspA family protein
VFCACGAVSTGNLSQSLEFSARDARHAARVMVCCLQDQQAAAVHRRRQRAEGVMVIRSILCPVDFSSDSRDILRSALAIARQERAKVTVLHVLEPLLMQAAALSAERDWLTQTTNTELAQLIESAVEGTGIDPQSIERCVWFAETAEGILAAAAEFATDLIVMGTEARRGVRRMFFGSTAARVLAHTPIPVLALPPNAPNLLMAGDGPFRLPVHQILVAIDFSDAGLLAVRDAAELAHRWGAGLVLLHVVPELPDAMHWGDALDRHQRHQIERARRELELVAREVEDVPVSVLTVEGAPDEGIIRVAAEQGSSLIALGLRRSRAGWFAPRPGSTAYRVLSLTNLPVLVLPGLPVAERQPARVGATAQEMAL